MSNRRAAKLSKVVSTKTVATTCMLLTVLGSLFSISFTSASAATADGTFQLAVTPLAPKLPADGKDYLMIIQLQTAKDGKPVEAPYDVDVTLVTSDKTVASSQADVMIKKGESLSIAALATTVKAGRAEITAISQGIAAGSALVETSSPDSLEPASLAVYTGASLFIPNPSIPGKMYVQLLNSGGIPAVTNKALNVYLSTADPKIGSVPKYVTIPAGAAGASFNFTPTSLAGKTNVIASANGLSPVEAKISTSGAVGTNLAIEFAPPSMPAPVGFYSDFVVQLRDSSGVPVLAKQSISVSLFSSNTNVATVPGGLVIEQGSSYALGRIRANGSVGITTVTASAQGLASGAGTMETFTHTEASESSPKMITAYSLPSMIVPNNSEKASIVVQVTDMNRNVYSQKSYLYNSVQLSNSNSNAGSIESNILAQEMDYATTTFKSSFYQGQSTISASASGYSAGYATVSTEGFSPFSLEVTQIPGVTLADGRPGGSLIVSLLDEREKPTIAQRDIALSLSSSDPEIATVEPTERISAGKSYVQVQVKPTIKAGTTVITAQAEGLAPNSVEFKTVGNMGDSSQYRLGLTGAPKLPADGRTHEAMFVQLQNSNGNPVPAESDIPVILSTSLASAGATDKSVVIKKGSSYAPVSLTTTASPAKFKITASSTGFATVDRDMETTAQPLTIVISSKLPSKAAFEKLPVAVDIYSNSFQVANATVEVSGSQAEKTTTATDANGHAESTYIPTFPGKNSIVFTASKPGYDIQTLSSTIQLDQSVSISIAAQTEGGKPIQVQIKVSGPSSKTLSTKTDLDSKTTLADVKWGTYKISAPAQIDGSDAKYKFVMWSDGKTENPRTADVISDTSFTAIYSAQYLLTIFSDKGIATGGGYYNEGQKATISTNTASTDNLLIDSTFAGWTGDIRSDAQTTDLVMDNPKVVKAEWNSSYFKVIAILGGISAGGFIVYIKMVKPKMQARAKARAPDLDWYKS